MGQRTYSSEFKLQVVLEALQSNGTDAEVARAYDVHPVTLSGWKTKLRENGSKGFFVFLWVPGVKDAFAVMSVQCVSVTGLGVLAGWHDIPGSVRSRRGRRLCGHTVRQSQ